MDRVVLGRTGLEVSVAGLGAGGNSRLGQRQNASIDDSIRIVHEALDLGVTYFDTAEAYGTEELLGRALANHRDEVVISTKVVARFPGRERLDRAGLRRAAESSLSRLGVETIDVYHLHGVEEPDYDYCITELLPVLDDLRSSGAIRFLALSEYFPAELDHVTLRRAASDGYFDVLMAGFNILNPSARRTLLPLTIAGNLGIEVMYAVRTSLSQVAALKAEIAAVVTKGMMPAGLLDEDDPLGFLVHNGGATSMIDAAYRFARHEPGCHVVLTGTGSIEHLRSNIESINSPPLPEYDLARLAEIFGDLVAFSAD